MRALLSLLLALALWPAIAATAGAAPLAEQALAAVNADRQAAGLPPLALSERLNRTAQVHADDMASRNYFDHASPEGETAKERFLAAGGSPWLAVAENLAHCQGCAGEVGAARIARLQAGWMASTDHRRNLLGAAFERFGFGIARDGADGLYAVQVFAGPGAPLDSGVGGGETPAQAVPPAVAADLVADRIGTARRAVGRTPLAASEVLAETAMALLPAGGAPLALPADSIAALPAAARGDWARIVVLGAACGACGRAVTDADLRAFAER
ncbi:CAP domain-containing protein, partial [Marinibaculum pumilum]